jgi:hypothetical protein
MSSPVIERLYEDNKLLLGRLVAANEVSLAATIDDVFRKALLLAAASYFKQAICSAILKYVSDRADADAAVVALTKVKAIDRQYHTYFEWDSPNANSFFGYFGDAYKQHAKARVEKDPALREAIRAFLEIGSLRNQLVHRDFATFTLNKTSDEICSSYKLALPFVEFVPKSLRYFSRK